MSACVEVVESGIAVTLQDLGRTGYRNIGVPVSGALDPIMMAAANALLGNDTAATVLEVCLSGPALKAVSGTLRVALTGELTGQILSANGRLLKVGAWETATLFPGDLIRIGSVSRGVAYVGLSGGIQLAGQLGSCSTYLRAAIGGYQGRALRVGDRLQCHPLSGDPWLEFRGSGVPAAQSGPIRVIPGPQDEYFTAAALADFFGTPYRVSRDADRMGMRLEGRALAHNEKGAEIVSDGVTPGSIQVPPNGQPIVLMADCQTSGGYPKVATVIRADLPRLAHLRPGDEVCFAAVDHAVAQLALRQQLAALQAWREAIESFRPPGVIDEAALYGGNLVSGAIRGDEAALHESVSMQGFEKGARHV
ncbi:MAG: biotin-dependent carboxyltransferase family protein [Rhodocyclales bacterium GT-UBC]|nr:MAG: biotin-dependent carboxyltransferase family protein [Rhodocyclales bacterium GT-UBC]